MEFVTCSPWRLGGALNVSADDELVGAVSGLGVAGVKGEAFAVKKDVPEEETKLCL